MGPQEEQPAKWRQARFHHMRFVVVSMCGLAIGSMMLLRYNISVAILKMVKQEPLNVTQQHQEPLVHSDGFNWNNEVQQMLMSWYMFAYTLPQVPLTKVAERFGARRTMAFSLALSAASNLATPAAAPYGWQWVLVLRLINGISVAPVLPVVLGLIERWMPGEQMSLGLTISTFIQSIIQAVTPLVCGHLARLHWSYAFTVPALVVLLFCTLWWLLVDDSPQVSRLASQRELQAIQVSRSELEHRKSTASAAKAKERLELDNMVQAEPNWTHVLRTPSTYAYLAIWSLYCSVSGCFTFALPTYLRQFLHVPVDQNGMICFVIQLGTLVSISWPHPVARLLARRLSMSTTNARRLMYLVCCSVVFACWFTIATNHSNQLVLLFLSRCFHASNDVIIVSSVMDNWAHVGLSSVAYSIVNTVGNLMLVPASTGLGWLLDYTGKSVAGWSLAFYTMAAIQPVGLLLFLLCITARPVKVHRLLGQRPAAPA